MSIYKYRNYRFRSFLEARWAAFFDLAGWEWEYMPLVIGDWAPEFLVSFPCGHSECQGSHSLLATVRPFTCMDQFKNHVCLEYPYGHRNEEEYIPADAGAAFGYHPRVSEWEMGHGSGGGEECVARWADHGDGVDEERLNEMWNIAGCNVALENPSN